MPPPARYLRETADFNEDAGKWVQTAFYEQRAGDTARSLDTLKEAYERFDKNVEIGIFTRWPCRTTASTAAPPVF